MNLHSALEPVHVALEHSRHYVTFHRSLELLPSQLLTKPVSRGVLGGTGVVLADPSSKTETKGLNHQTE